MVGKTLLPHPSSSNSLVSPQTSEEAREKRRRKAKEAQDRLMKEFALKQKEFLGTNCLHCKAMRTLNDQLAARFMLTVEC